MWQKNILFLKWLLLLLVFPAISFAQKKHDDSLRRYFRNPVGLPMELVANFGELRSDHWHMGLDIRTNQKENQPIYAAADGFISHVGIRPQSFGRFIIIDHPNGLSTLYAHLNNFFGGLEEYVTAQQYKQESWAVELDFTKDQFPVRKGDFISYSGNTGGSQGPHLHFEIFDTKTTKRLNPLLFDFPVQDNTPPLLTRLAIYDRSKSVFLQKPLLLPLKKTDSGYIIPKMPVIKTGWRKLSFALQMIDMMKNGGRDNGVFTSTLYFDDEPQVKFVLDSIDYFETKYINAHIDYKHDYNGGVFLQHLSALPGHNGAEYKKIRGDGVIHLTDTMLHYVSVDVKDTDFNTSQLNFAVQFYDSLAAEIQQEVEYEKFLPNKPNEFRREDFEIAIPENCLYDAVPVSYYRFNSNTYNAISALHQVSDASYPVHTPFTVKIKPVKTIPDNWKEKLIIIRTDRKSRQVRKAEWQDGWLTAKFGDFGSFQVFADITPPAINSLGKGDTVNLSPASRIIFTPTDNFGIKKFRAELDSQWIRFTNDKSRNWIYIFDERCPYGVHNLKVEVEDLAGNTTVKEWWFKRYPYTPPKKKVVKKSSAKKKGAVNKKKK